MIIAHTNCTKNPYAQGRGEGRNYAQRQKMLVSAKKWQE